MTLSKRKKEILTKECTDHQILVLKRQQSILSFPEGYRKYISLKYVPLKMTTSIQYIILSPISYTFSNKEIKVKNTYQNICCNASQDISAPHQVILHIQLPQLIHPATRYSQDKDPDQEHKTARVLQTKPTTRQPYIKEVLCSFVKNRQPRSDIQQNESSCLNSNCSMPQNRLSSFV